jgi:hypothetical protein
LHPNPNRLALRISNRDQHRSINHAFLEFFKRDILYRGGRLLDGRRNFRQCFSQSFNYLNLPDYLYRSRRHIESCFRHGDGDSANRFYQRESYSCYCRCELNHLVDFVSSE